MIKCNFFSKNYLLAILVSLIVLTITFALPVKAGSLDQFAILEKLNVGMRLPVEIIAQEKLSDNIDISQFEDKKIYVFTSENYSNPHIIHTTLGNRIVFIQLTIPQEEQEKYKNLMISYGTSELISGKNQSEILMGFPNKGISFIVNNYSNGVLRIQKFPKKSVDDFNGQEGQFFVPLSIAETNVETGRFQTNSVIPPQTGDQKIILGIIVGFFLTLGIAVFLFLSRKRKYNTTGKD